MLLGTNNVPRRGLREACVRPVEKAHFDRSLFLATADENFRGLKGDEASGPRPQHRRYLRAAMGVLPMSLVLLQP